MCDWVTDSTPPITWASADELVASNTPTANVQYNRCMVFLPWAGVEDSSSYGALGSLLGELEVRDVEHGRFPLARLLLLFRRQLLQDRRPLATPSLDTAGHADDLLPLRHRLAQPAQGGLLSL